MTFHLTIVTPEKTVLDTEVDELIVPTTTGELAILPHHVSLFTQLAEGELVMKHNGKSDVFVVVGGFVEVGEKSTTILADYAAHGKDISAVEAQKAKERAEKAMKEKKSVVDFAIAEAEFRRALLELKVANKYKSSR
jgi:F-type H+-transporting ATPase subunit epsilon